MHRIAFPLTFTRPVCGAVADRGTSISRSHVSARKLWLRFGCFAAFFLALEVSSAVTINVRLDTARTPPNNPHLFTITVNSTPFNVTSTDIGVRPISLDIGDIPAGESRNFSISALFTGDTTPRDIDQMVWFWLEFENFSDYMSYMWHNGSFAPKKGTMHGSLGTGFGYQQGRYSKHAYQAGVYTYQFTIFNDAPTPRITDVQRQYPGVFLAGTTLDNRFDVSVDWMGLPGKVTFGIGYSFFDVIGDADGASHTFKMGDFTPSSTPTVISILARNAEGQLSPARFENICVVPHPQWLTAAIAGGRYVRYEISNGDAKARFSADYPTPHLAKDGPIDIPKDIPFIGGKFGLTETFARLEGEVSSNSGRGSVTLSGQTGFTAGGQSLTGQVSGSGDIFLLCQDGLQVDSTTFRLNLTGNIKEEAGIADVVPQLIALQRVPVIGGAVRWFNQRATLTGEIEPSLDFTAVFKQDAVGHLKFNDTTGKFGLNLKATLSADLIDDRLSATGWVAGGGSSTLAVPVEPFVRDLKITFEAGVEFKLDYLIKKNWRAETGYYCAWTPETGTVCGKTDQGSAANESSESSHNNKSEAAPAFSVIEHGYAKFGPHAQFSPGVGGTAAAVFGSTVVSNLFAGASPTTIELASGAQLLLWADADTALPASRATNIMWSMRSAGGNWSAPQPIATDTRAEFSPVAGLDSSGKVVAAWLRVKDANFPTAIETTEDVALFYKSFEVVTAAFDPATRIWSTVAQITDDHALDTSLELSSDGKGGLMLSWISNPGGELMSAANSPAALKYSLRNGNSWGAPGVLGGALVGVSDHAAAIHGAEAFIILPRDVDPDSTNDGVLDAYRLKNGEWTGGTFAADGVENTVPSVAYDSAGVAHIVWQRAADLVSATLDNPEPQIVRAGSTGFGFYDVQLVADAQGNLAIIYQEPVKDGAANLFAALYSTTTKNWSKGHHIVEDAQQSRNPSAYFDAEGSLRIAYLATEIVRTTRTVTINGIGHVIENIPLEGRTDLKSVEVSGDFLPPSVLANVSTRMRVDIGDNALIAGFIITGNQPKKVLIRGLGPSLPLGGTLADPTLELDGGVLTNDNWRSSQELEIIGSTIPPSNNLESAIVATLAPGPHTAVLRGQNGGVGVGLVEVYDLDSEAAEQLANISTRGLVQRGDDVMIGGFILVGDKPAKVLLRAIGPSLSSQGVSGALPDPMLELVDSQGNRIANDDWRATQEEEIIATTAPPTDDREAAIVTTLAPGAYTAIIRGKDNAVGVALVEAYNLQ